jgi:hypothetical protein
MNEWLYLRCKLVVSAGCAFSLEVTEYFQTKTQDKMTIATIIPNHILHLELTALFHLPAMLFTMAGPNMIV